MSRLGHFSQPLQNEKSYNVAGCSEDSGRDEVGEGAEQSKADCYFYRAIQLASRKTDVAHQNMTFSASFCLAQISHGHLDRVIPLPTWPLPKKETNHDDVAELEILAKRVNNCVPLQLRDGWESCSKAKTSSFLEKEGLISWTGSLAGYRMANKAELIKINQLGLCQCLSICTPVVLEFHLLINKGRAAPTYTPSGWGEERMGIMLSRDASVFSDVKRGHVSADFPDHTQLSGSLGPSVPFSFTLCEALKRVSYLDDNVIYTEIS